MDGAQPPRVAAAFSERDLSYLKLLKSLRRGAGGGGELGVVRRIAEWIDSAPILERICATTQWYDDWELKEALLHNDLTPPERRVELERAIAIFDLLRELDAPELSATEKREIEEDVRYLFRTLSERDRQVVKQRAYLLSSSRDGAPRPRSTVAEIAEAPPAPPRRSLLAEELSGIFPTGHSLPDGGVTQAIRVAEDEAIGVLLREAEARAAPEAPPSVVPGPEAPTAPGAPPPPEAPAPAVSERPEPLPSVEAPGPADRRSSELGAEDRLAAARASTEVELLERLAFEPSEELQLALLENPALSDRQAATLARRAGTRVAQAIYRQRRLFMRPLVQAALLECPNAPSVALLEIVNGISDLPGLLRLIRSPKVRFLEVKAKARHRLATIFRSLGTGEKIAAIRRAGRGVIKELWTDFFRDEQLVLRLLAERQLDSGTVLEIARSKIAPRRALEAIGNSAQWTSNYQVCLELVLNPKTPRQVVAKLVRRLSPADRRMVQQNPALPESIRRMT